jgi:hypothetical protein
MPLHTIDLVMQGGDVFISRGVLFEMGCEVEETLD